MIHSQKQPQMEAVLVIGHFLWVSTTGPVTLQDIQGDSKVRQKKIACYPPEIIYLLLRKMTVCYGKSPFLINKSSYMCHVQPCENNGGKKKTCREIRPFAGTRPQGAGASPSAGGRMVRTEVTTAGWFIPWKILYPVSPIVSAGDHQNPIIKIDDSGAPPF